MPETLTLDDKPVIEQLASEHPDTHEALKDLPPHIIEHVGSLALKLTHIDMHPVTVTEYQGKTYKKADYTKRILDADGDELGLEQSSIEAAKDGKEKLAQVLHASSATLALAHAVLVARGHTFESPPDESDDDKEKRQSQEKNDIAVAAYHIAAERAIELKRSGNQRALIEQLEALNAIAYLSGSKYGDKAIGTTYRHLVHEGLAEEMVTALQESIKIGTTSFDDRVSSPLSMQSSMLQIATGKKIDYDFTVTGELDIDKLTRIDGSSPMLEITAIITSPHITMPEETRKKILEKMSNWSSQPKLKAKLDELGSYADGADYYKIAELCEKEGYQDFFRTVLEADKPIELKNYADTLGLTLIDTIRILAPRSKEDFNVMSFDSEGARNLQEILGRYPELFKIIVEESKSRTPTGRYDLVLKATDELNAAGLTNESILRSIVSSDTNELGNFTAATIYAFEYGKKKGLSPEEFIEKMKHSESGENFYWKLAAVLKNSTSQESTKSKQEIEKNLDTALEEIMIESSINKSYRSMYEKVHYPASPDIVKTIRLDLETFPEIASQMLELGLDLETARAIFASWATFNALQKHGYNNESGFVTIEEMPTGDVMKSILSEQAQAIKNQIRAIKEYHAEYGEKELKDVISIFGIYNFNRHSPAGLHNQLERWNSGQIAETVVAESRSDWNSYTGKPVKFEDESEKIGAFYFEVNSPIELSRIAVRVGQRERQNGREPNVGRFIVHAHGNPTGLLLGVNNERLTINEYREAAQSRTKINGAETNNYRRHLGPNFRVILQSCSGAGETMGKNIAAVMAGDLDASVTGASDTITGLVIKADGTVEYESGYKKTAESITYDS